MVGFLDLPLPVRERIYRHALVKRRIFVRPFVPMVYFLDQRCKYINDPPNLAVMCVSRRIYSEAMPIYLAENTFSIVQADLLAATRLECPRVFQSLKLIRRIEIVCDIRDYVYLAQFLLDRLPLIRTEVKAIADESRHKDKVLQTLENVRSDYDIEGVHRARQPSRRLSVEDEQDVHERHIDNIKEYLWGRTLTFVRQTFRLSHLYVDLRGCTCANGCCRLADEVLSWGRFYVWAHGLPDEVHVRGTSKREKDAIASILDRQQFHQGMEKGDIYDVKKAGDSLGFRQFNEIMRDTYRKIVHRQSH